MSGSLKTTLTGERSRKELALEHCRRLNAGDVEGLLRLYADDVAFEDPVGWKQQTGRAALRAHLTQAVAAHAVEIPGEPVAGQDGAHVLVPVTAVMDYLPQGPVFAERGWLTPPADPEHKSLKRYYVLLLRIGPDGLIQQMKAFWGRSDLDVAAGLAPGPPPVRQACVASEAARKAMALDYVRRINSGDIDGVLGLFGDDVVFEDPVGRPPLVGKDALRGHIELAVQAQAHETPGPPVTSMDDRFVVTQTRVVVQAPAVMTFNIIGVVELSADGLGRHVRAFWGMTDMAIGGQAGQPAGAAGARQ